MSFHGFLQSKGNEIKNATVQDASTYLEKNGPTYEMKDYIWKYEDRDAFWKAILWSKYSQMQDITLHTRLSCERKSNVEWKRFKEKVIPITRQQPTVPPLPE